VVARRATGRDADAVAQEPDPPTFVVLSEEEDADYPADYPGEFPAEVSGAFPGELSGEAPGEYFGGPGAGRPPLAGPWAVLARHRRLRWAAALLACLVAGAILVVAGTSEHAAIRTATPAGPAPFRMPSPKLLADGKPWPTSPSSCGSVRYLPLVTADPLRARTGVRVRVGGQSVHTVDLDTRADVATPGLSLPATRFVAQLVPGRDASYALVQPCESTDTSAVLRVGRGSSNLVLASDRHIDSLLGDGRGGVWAAEVADIATDAPITLVRLPGPGVVRLPIGLNPVAIHGDRLIGLKPASDGRRSASSGTLVSYDLATRRLGGTLGRASSLTVSAGRLLWIDKPCSITASCALHGYDLATGATSVRRYRLPIETSIVGGVLSPDRTKLAFQLERIYEGPHIDNEGFGPPTDVAVLDLRTGALDRVSGLTLPPTEVPGLAFSAAGDWLVIALNQGRDAELLLWQPGLPRPLRPGVRISDLMLQAPPVLAVAP